MKQKLILVLYVGDDQIDYERGENKTNKHDQCIGLVNIHACPINHLSLSLRFLFLLRFLFVFSEWNLIGSR